MLAQRSDSLLIRSGTRSLIPTFDHSSRLIVCMHVCPTISDYPRLHTAIYVHRSAVVIPRSRRLAEVDRTVQRFVVAEQLGHG